MISTASGYGKYELPLLQNIFICLEPEAQNSDSDPVTATSSTVTVDWTALQAVFLTSCKSHVLFLLDCCFAASSAQYKDAESTVEAIVASGFESVAPLQGKDSFTTFLRAALRECRTNNERIYAGRLCSRVCASLNLERRILEHGGGRRVTPFHITFSNSEHRIMMCPLPKASNDPVTRQFLPQSKEGSSTRLTEVYVLLTGKGLGENADCLSASIFQVKQRKDRAAHLRLNRCWQHPLRRSGRYTAHRLLMELSTDQYFQTSPENGLHTTSMSFTRRNDLETMIFVC